jgi:hypothetical protein
METRRFSESQLSGEDPQKGLIEVQGVSQRFGEIRGDFWGQGQPAAASEPPFRDPHLHGCPP